MSEENVKEVDARIHALEQMLQNLHEKHRNEIQQLRDYYENIIAIMPGHVYWLDRNHVYLGCNDLQASHLNLQNRKEIVGKTNSDLVDVDLARKLDDVNEQVMHADENYFIEESGEIASGAGFYLTQKVPLKNRAGEIIGLLGISFDITERKKVEELSKENIKLEEQQKITQLYAERMQLISASMAHELKTPLISIQYLSEALNHYFKNDMNPAQLPTMTDASLSIYKESKNALHMMEMLLFNLHYQSQGIQSSDFKKHSMLDVVKNALKRYPFTDAYQSQSILVRSKQDDDFQFFGSDMLMMQVIFNLLKNALYVMRIEKKGIITIWFTEESDHHQLHFRDTAKGMPEEIRAKLFQSFFSTKKFGTGIGLAFCKLVMESMHGSISCTAEEGKYAEFILHIPKIS